MGVTGILGGTFDPVHCGHLRLAIEMRERLRLDAVRLMPAGDPQLRGAPHAGAEDRLAMLRLAVGDEQWLDIDECEVDREGPTYTVETLETLRGGSGGAPLCLIIGMDAFTRLERWHRWEDLFELCHLAIAQRPGSQMPVTGALNEVFRARRCDDAAALEREPCGRIALVTMPLLDVSATQIRDAVRGGRSIRWLVPPAVERFIDDRGLYTAAPGSPG